MTYKVVAFYKFFSISNLQHTQLDFKAFCAFHNICGTVLVAGEGLNGTVAGSGAGIDAFIQKLMLQFDLTIEDYKCSHASEKPFPKMKVKIKQEIVTLKQPHVDPTKLVGTYVDPQDWNAIISDPNVVVLDTRNHFEVQMGTFENAADPVTECFSEFPEYVKKNLDPKKNKKIAMFCTGGIRCEKASSYMLSEGFEEVYHLKGGILKYLEEVPAENSKWMGDCFVFDGRVGIAHGLQEMKKD